MDEDYCHTCRFWQSFDNEVFDGDCRREAPKLAGMAAPHGNATFQDPKAAMWPTTQRDDWCGEFAPNPSHPKGEQEL